MIDVEMIFRYKKANPKKLLDYNFVYRDGVYTRSFLILREQFCLEVTVDERSRVDYRLMEVETNEEYVLIKVASATGKFLAKVSTACQEVLTMISNECFDTNLLGGEQTERVIRHLKDRYDIEPEFLWENSRNCAFRLRDSKKWVAVMLTVERRKLGLDGDGRIEIIDLKDIPEHIQKRRDDKIFFGGYHMNKKHWYTICLNDSLSDEELFALIHDSYCLVKKSLSKKKKQLC